MKYSSNNAHLTKRLQQNSSQVKQTIILHKKRSSIVALDLNHMVSGRPGSHSLKLFWLGS